VVACEVLMDDAADPITSTLQSWFALRAVQQ
jgi:hypothetical protein